MAPEGGDGPPLVGLDRRLADPGDRGHVTDAEVDDEAHRQDVALDRGQEVEEVEDPAALEAMEGLLLDVAGDGAVQTGRLDRFGRAPAGPAGPVDQPPPGDDEGHGPEARPVTVDAVDDPGQVEEDVAEDAVGIGRAPQRDEGPQRRPELVDHLAPGGLGSRLEVVDARRGWLRRPGRGPLLPAGRRPGEGGPRATLAAIRGAAGSISRAYPCSSQLDDDRLVDRLERSEGVEHVGPGGGIEVDERQGLGPIGVPTEAPLGDVDAVLTEHPADRADHAGYVVVEHQQDDAGRVGLEAVVGDLDDAGVVVREDDAGDRALAVAPADPAGDLVAVVGLAEADRAGDLDPSLPGHDRRVDEVDRAGHGRIEDALEEAGGDGAHHVLGVVGVQLELDLFDLAVGHDRLQASDLGREADELVGPGEVEAGGKSHVDAVGDAGAAEGVDDLLGDLDGHAALGLGGRGAEVGGVEDLGVADQGVAGGRGLDVEHVDGRFGQPALVEGGGDGGGVDEAAPGCVDQDRSGLDDGESGGVDQVAGLVGEGRVEGDVVGGGEQLVEIDELDAGLPADPLADEGVVGQNRHLEGLGPGRDGPADPAEADDAEGLVA